MILQVARQGSEIHYVKHWPGPGDASLARTVITGHGAEGPWVLEVMSAGDQWWAGEIESLFDSNALGDRNLVVALIRYVQQRLLVVLLTNKRERVAQRALRRERRRMKRNFLRLHPDLGRRRNHCIRWTADGLLKAAAMRRALHRIELVDYFIGEGQRSEPVVIDDLVVINEAQAFARVPDADYKLTDVKSNSPVTGKLWGWRDGKWEPL